jgi:hypothetical protein
LTPGPGGKKIDPKNKNLPKKIKNSLIFVPPPPSEMNNVDINFDKLIDLVAQKDESEKKNFVENQNLRTEQGVVSIKEDELNIASSDLNNLKDIKKLISLYEKVLNENEKKYLWRMYLTYSSDNVSRIFFKNIFFLHKLFPLLK